MNKRIAIIGISGTGKSTLAVKLSKLLNIPVIHVDQHIWKENWNEVDEDEAVTSLGKVLENEKWIAEGWITPCTELRLKRADIILYLDYSGIRAAIGGLKRWWMYRGKKRPEMPDGCSEKTSIDWHYLWVMIGRYERNEIEKYLHSYTNSNKLVRLYSPRKTNQFIMDNFESPPE